MSTPDAAAHPSAANGLMAIATAVTTAKLTRAFSPPTNDLLMSLSLPTLVVR